MNDKEIVELAEQLYNTHQEALELSHDDFMGTGWINLDIKVRDAWIEVAKFVDENREDYAREVSGYIW